jgi:hypothetical protein
MPDTLTQALNDPGPHTVESLARRLPDFPPDAIRDALEALTAQGVLQREGEGYRYVSPEKYHQADLDVVKNPGTGIKRRPR